jgi:hypothetical protein
MPRRKHTPDESGAMCRTALALLGAACCLVADRGLIARADATPLIVVGSDAACGRPRDSRPLTYRNARFGLVMSYPSSFVLDADSVPASGDSARFWAADRQATAVVGGIGNGLQQSLADLFREAKQDVTENSGGEITYTRIKDNWFVISGLIGNRIFYRRTLLSQGARVIGELWIEFPRSMRPCFEDAVTLMSLSFRQESP